MSTCRSCFAPITWAATERGRHMPLQRHLLGDWLIRSGLAVHIAGSITPTAGEPRWIPHWAMCPDAEHWRRRHA
jgi:hypothetical protein